MLLANLARSLKDLSRAAEASRYADRAYTQARAANDEIVVNQSLILRAGAYRELGDFERSAAALAELEPRLARMLPPGHVAFASLHSEEALLAQARGALPAAKTDADRSVTLAENGSEKVVFLPLALQRRSQLELQMHRWEEARSDASRALRLYGDAIGPGTPSNRIGRCDLFLGRALLELKRPVEARAALAEALENLEKSQGADHPETRDARKLLAATTLAAR
jgi:tetratricopeptide (TPR) repeat protein